MKASETVGGLGVALLAILCCAGVPILIAVGAAVSTAALLGGLGAALGVAIVGAAIIAVRRKHHAARTRPHPHRSSPRGLGG